MDPEERFSGTYTDGLGFIRKKRNNMGIVLWIAVGIGNLLLGFSPSKYYILEVLSWPVSAYLLLIAIQMASSHDINTWRGTPWIKLWIFLGNLISGLIGLIIYALLKWREKNYLKKMLRQ
ncbi:MAG: hypothetical protein IPI63_10680 [Methanothrix sp.]|jgi:hypothetical protein|nr:hypothetical protein [Methanothrix sp.]MBK7387145.1 hypothetical protein [Methanothrix sp.]HPW72602.1 hypothetical protein [Methanothrix sp.]